MFNNQLEQSIIDGDIERTRVIVRRIIRRECRDARTAIGVDMTEHAETICKKIVPNIGSRKLSRLRNAHTFFKSTARHEIRDLAATLTRAKANQNALKPITH